MAKHFHTLRHDVWLPYRFAVGPAFNRFYEGLKAEKILGNKCPECGIVLVPARTFCPHVLWTWESGRRSVRRVKV